MTRTIVFHHPVPGAGIAPPATITDPDVVIACPDRPGYRSRPAVEPGAPPTITDTSAQLLEQLRRDGIDHIDNVVGWSGGGHYALAMAALATDSVDAVTLIATPAHDDHVAWVPDHLRPRLERWRAAPQQAVDLIRSEFAHVAPEHSMLCSGADDEQLLDTDSAVRAWIDQLLAAAFLTGPVGMAHDIVAQHVNDWGFDAVDVSVPVRLVYAADDPIVPIAHGRHWAETLPHAELSVVAASGHLTPLHHAWHGLSNPTRPDSST